MPTDQIIEEDLVTVTETTAIAAAHTMGLGEGDRSDRVAVEAMHGALAGCDLAGRVVIGKATPGSLLRVGDAVGSLDAGDGAEPVDVAVYPLEGVSLCATGTPGAVAALATAEHGDLLEAPDAYMEKLVVGPTARGVVHLDAPVPENLRNIARAFGREVSDLTVVVLDRERHRQLIADIRDAGARIRLISDGVLAAEISAAVRGTGVHAVMGTGRAPEGVIAAAAMRCLGGEIQGRLVALDEEQEKSLADFGFTDLERIYNTADLARGERLLFSCTGVTDGELLRGVRFFGGGTRTSSLFMSLAGGVVRFIDTIRREEPSSPLQFR